MPICISSEQAQPFAQDFLDSYCAVGFGAIPKREVDLLVLRLLLQHGLVDKAMDAQRISREIQLPVSKVKTLLYELQLRDERKDEAWLKGELSRSLKHSKITVTGKDSETRIAIGIDNQLLRAEIEALLKRDGHFPDYSFNREILRLTPDAYVTLVDFLLTESEQKILRDELMVATKKAKKSESEESLWRMALTTFIRRTAESTGQGIGDLSVDILKTGFTLLVAQLFNS